MGRAERAFRDAFHRMKLGVPNLVSRGTPVTQNNIAREAGLDPSALKKARFPSLVAEIQHWIDEHKDASPPSARQSKIGQKNRNRDTKARLDAMKIQRDKALGLLAEADQRILELTLENARLKADMPPSNVTHMSGLNKR